MRLKIPNESLFPKINTLRFKISILYVAIIGLILALFQGVLYYNYANSISREFDVQLHIKAEQIGGAVNTFRDMLGQERQAFTMAAQRAVDLGIEYPEYAFMSESPEKFWLADARKLGLDKDYLVIMDRQGGVITSSSNVTGDLLAYFERLGSSKLNEIKYYNTRSNNGILRIVIEPYSYSYRQGYIIAVGTSYALIEHILRKHLLFIVLSTLLFLVIASLIVRIFVVSVLSSVLEISKVARNITQENLHARIRLTHADEEIEHLTGSLNEMISRLEGSFAHIKEFSMEMAHEVKTPLAIISGESQLALKEDHTNEEYKEMFRSVLNESKRTQRFVSDLMLLTKLDYRLIQLRFEDMDLSVFLREICERMRVIFVPQGIRIQQDIPPEPVLIKGDKIHLRRVFFNLIDNALKFTPQGGSVDLVLRHQDHKALVLVTDFGCGMAADEVSSVFNKFYRIVKNDQEVNTGCGLGLSIVSSIVKIHGGSISAHSKLGEGTTFRMEFPLIK